MDQLTQYLELASIFENMPLLGMEVMQAGDGDLQSQEILCEIINEITPIISSLSDQPSANWLNASKAFLHAVVSRQVFHSSMNEWIKIGETLLAHKLIPFLYELSALDQKSAETFVHFFEGSSLIAESKAMGIYRAALFMSQAAPSFCYEKSLEAFSLYPQLASIYKSEYLYQPDTLLESYQDCCPICNSTDAASHYCIQQLLTLKTNSSFSPAKLWMKCNSCQNLYAYNFPVFSMGEINGHYTKSFKEGFIQPRYPMRIYSDIFNKCREYTTGREYLEIGIGGGEMLAAALEMGYQVNAVEICKEDCEKVASILDIDIQWADFLEYKSDKKYDIIIMGDVLEHISNPTAALEKAKNLLNKHGVLWLSTPNFNSGYSRLMGYMDPMWNQKNHFTYFSYETLVPILEDLSLTVKRYDISDRYNGSMELFIQHA